MFSVQERSLYLYLILLRSRNFHCTCTQVFPVTLHKFSLNLYTSCYCIYAEVFCTGKFTLPVQDHVIVMFRRVLCILILLYRATSTFTGEFIVSLLDYTLYLFSREPYIFIGLYTLPVQMFYLVSK